MSMYDGYSKAGLIFGNSGGGGGGTTNFEQLTNRPKVNDILIDKNSTSASLGISKTYALNNTTIEGHTVFDIPVETITDIYNMMSKGAICILSDTSGNMHRLVSSADTDGDNVYIIVQYDNILVRYVDDGTRVYSERQPSDFIANATIIMNAEQTEGTATVDKTFDEFMSAIESGKNIKVVAETTVQTRPVETGTMEFTHCYYVENEFLSINTVTLNRNLTIIVNRDNTIEFYVDTYQSENFLVEAFVNLITGTTMVSKTYDEIKSAMDSDKNINMRAYIPTLGDGEIEIEDYSFSSEESVFVFQFLIENVQFKITIDKQSTDVEGEFVDVVETEIKELQYKPEYDTIVLVSADWIDNEQTVSFDGIDADSLIQVSPIPSNVDVYAKAKIICTAQGDGTLTFTCDSVPTSNLTVTVVNWG